MNQEAEPSRVSPETSAALEHLREELLGAFERSSKSSRRWEVVIVVLQVGLTSLLGFWVWRTQHGATREMETNLRLISTQLALSEKYYERRLEAYAELHERLSSLHSAARRWSVTSVPHGPVATAAGELHRLSQDRSLYLSERLQESLGQVWREAMDLRALEGRRSITDFLASLAEVKATMREDLSVDWLAAQPRLGSGASTQRLEADGR